MIYEINALNGLILDTHFVRDLPNPEKSHPENSSNLAKKFKDDPEAYVSFILKNSGMTDSQIEKYKKKHPNYLKTFQKAWKNTIKELERINKLE